MEDYPDIPPINYDYKKMFFILNKGINDVDVFLGNKMLEKGRIDTQEGIDLLLLIRDYRNRVSKSCDPTFIPNKTNEIETIKNRHLSL